MQEYLLDTDNYKKPLVAKDKDALAIKILRLLLMEPGENPMHPEMGVDVVGRYRYCSEDDLAELQLEISNQMSAYLPAYRTTEINCYIEKMHLVIKINIDDTVYSYSTNDQDTDSISLLSDV